MPFMNCFILQAIKSNFIKLRIKKAEKINDDDEKEV